MVMKDGCLSTGISEMMVVWATPGRAAAAELPKAVLPRATLTILNKMLAYGTLATIDSRLFSSSAPGIARIASELLLLEDHGEIRMIEDAATFCSHALDRDLTWLHPSRTFIAKVVKEDDMHMHMHRARMAADFRLNQARQ